MRIRLAEENDLERVNELRQQVNAIHAAGKPDVFKPGFAEDLRDFIHVIWHDPDQDIVVAEADGVICGFAVLHHINRPENPFMYERDFIDIDEFCVDQSCRRQGAASALVCFIREYALAAVRRFAEVSFRRKCLSFRFVCNRNDGRFLYHYGRRPKMQLSMFAKRNTSWKEAFQGKGMFVSHGILRAMIMGKRRIPPGWRRAEALI